MPIPVHIQPRRMALPQGIVISLMLHLCMAVPFLALSMQQPPPREEKLSLDLQTLLAERLADPQPPMPPAPRQPAEETPKSLPPPKPVERVKTAKATKQATAPSPVQVAEESTLPEPPPSPMPQSAQRQTEPDALSLYTGLLRRKLQAGLVYNQDVRRAGISGVVTIGFTITEQGKLLTDTLRVIRSSGSPALDSNALSTALAVAPFDPPPRQISINVDIIFTN